MYSLKYMLAQYDDRNFPWIVRPFKCHLGVVEMDLYRDNIPFFKVIATGGGYSLRPQRYWLDLATIDHAKPILNRFCNPDSVTINPQKVISYQFWNSVFSVQDAWQPHDFIKHNQYFKEPWRASKMWERIIQIAGNINQDMDRPDLGIDIMYAYYYYGNDREIMYSHV